MELERDDVVGDDENVYLDGGRRQCDVLCGGGTCNAGRGEDGGKKEGRETAN